MACCTQGTWPTASDLGLSLWLPWLQHAGLCCSAVPQLSCTGPWHTRLLLPGGLPKGHRALLCLLFQPFSNATFSESHTTSLRPFVLHKKNTID